MVKKIKTKINEVYDKDFKLFGYEKSRIKM